MAAIPHQSPLLQAAHAGDRDALEALLQACHPGIRRYAQRHCLISDVDDAVQDALDGPRPAPREPLQWHAAGVAGASQTQRSN
nr:hypothetical protein [uncultured Albidiferax sp.]